MNLIYFITSLFVVELSGSPLNNDKNSIILNKRLFNPFKLFTKFIKGSPIRNDVQISISKGYNPQSFINPLNFSNQPGRTLGTTTGSNNPQASNNLDLEQLLASLKSPSYGTNTGVDSNPQASKISELEQLLDSIKLPASGTNTGINSNYQAPFNTPLSLTNTPPTLNLNYKQST